MPYITAYDEHTEEIEALTAVDEVLEGAAESVSRVAAERAKKFLEAVLKGDAAAAQNLFGLSGFTGRERDRPNPSRSPIIHGRLFEADPIKLRRELVEAHADLLRNARILDLEDMLEGARAQIERLEEANRRRGY